MAVYTDISVELLLEFLKDFNAGSLLSFKGIAEGVENTNYLIETDQGKFILTLYEKRVNEHDLPFFLSLKEFLKGNGLKVPVAIKNNKGKNLSQLSGRPAALISFLNGISINRPKKNHLSELGKGLAEFHLIGQKFKQTRANDFSLQKWHGLHKDLKGHLDQITARLDELIKTELTCLEKNWPDDLPQGIIHADLFPDNVFFLDDKLSGFIDFYFSCTDMLAYDLAICLNAWCFEPDLGFNVTNSRALFHSYQQKRPLTKNELEALPILARGAALRFLLTRSYDWVNTPDTALVKKKDPMEYLRKLKFHQTVESVSAYGIDE